MKERREAIKRFVDANGEVSIGRLCAEFSGWSEMTIRRDLAALGYQAVAKDWEACDF